MAHYTIRTSSTGITQFWDGLRWSTEARNAREFSRVTQAGKEACLLSTAGNGICTVYRHTKTEPHGYPDGRYINGDFELLTHVPGRGYVKQ